MDIELPKQYRDAIEPHVNDLVVVITKILPIVTEFGNRFTCKYDDVEIIIKKGKG